MASYKVAQDVEAEDKLLGPFSFRQFIYLVIAAMAGVLAYGLSRLFIGLAILPLPIVLFFLVLALPLRKDQPMEVYLAAIVSFYLKPRKRLWQPDGVQSLIEITADPSEEQQLTKDISGSEAERRLAYLATLADTKGWAIRNVAAPQQTNPSMNEDVYYDAQNTPDAFDENSTLVRSFDNMIDRADNARRQAIMEQMKSSATQTIPQSMYQIPQTPKEEPQISFNPYPTAMRQHIISPVPDPVVRPNKAADAQAHQAVDDTTSADDSSNSIHQHHHHAHGAPQIAPLPTPEFDIPEPPKPEPKPEEATSDETTSEKPLSPDIINLANNKDLTVETIAREAHRIEAKHRGDDEEVIISLR